MKIQVGALGDFFDSARETARELDHGARVTPKQRIWVAPEDFARLVKPERLKLIRYLRGKERVLFSDLAADMRRSAESLQRDLQLFARYHLIRIDHERQAGHGMRKVITPMFGSHPIECTVEI